MTQLNRRSFLQKSAMTSGLLFLSRKSRAYPDVQQKSPNAKTRLTQFSYSQIKLLEGPAREQFEQNHNFFLSLDEDGLLKPFRERAGLTAPGPIMGGWYNDSPDYNPPKNMTGYIPGHSFGQYLSGLSRAFAITGHRPTQEKVQRLVRGFGEAVAEKFYVNYPLPAYTFDKSSIGLLDAHEFAADPIALKVLEQATNAVLPFLPTGAQTREEACAVPHKNISFCWDETYTLPENFYLAYVRSGDTRYRAIAERFLQDHDYFDPLAENKNVLPGLHAYSHLNALSSAVQAYLVDGSQRHLGAALNGFNFVETTQSFATGGWGPNETFQKPDSGGLGDSLTKTHASFETPCGAYGHFKICRYLLGITGDSYYGDSMESVLYNTILGAKPIKEDGTSFYYSDYNMEAKKGYHPDKWPCCSGTFPQITADYGISSYFYDMDGIYVNLYLPSQLTWKQHGANLSLTQRTEYPYTAHIEFELKTDRDTAFALRLRIPAWSGSKTVLFINGQHVKADLMPGHFASISRYWKNGDRITLEFDIPLRLHAVDPQHPNLVALSHGSLTLFAVKPPVTHLTRANLLNARQLSTGSVDWEATTDTDKLFFKPFQAIQDEPYRLYQEVVS